MNRAFVPSVFLTARILSCEPRRQQGSTHNITNAKNPSEIRRIFLCGYCMVMVVMVDYGGYGGHGGLWWVMAVMVGFGGYGGYCCY